MHLKFHPIADSKRFLTVKVDLSVSDDYGRLDVANAVVRFQYVATEEQARAFDQAAVRRLLMENGAVKVIFQPTVERTVRARVAEMREDMDEASALELWLTNQGINGSGAEALRLAHSEYVGKLAAS